MAHAQGADGIKNAVRAGIRSIEHGIYLDDEAIELMKARGTWLVPTLVAPQGVIDAADAGVQLPAGGHRQGARSSSRSTGPRSATRSRPASGSRWAPTAASRPTATTSASWR